MVKTGEADDPVGVMTALSLQRYQAKPFLAELLAFLTEKCDSEQLKARLKQVGKLWVGGGALL